MIDVKEAVQKAKEFVKFLEPTVETKGITLEEVELSDDGRFWFVTLNVPVEFMGYISGKYKRFTVNSVTGDVTAMKMREVG